MSDDLIKRSDALNILDEMYKKEKDIIRSIYVRNSIKDEIEQIPTAFDIDKVVQELEEYKRIAFINGTMGIDVANKMIEIVKRLSMEV